MDKIRVNYELAFLIDEQLKSYNIYRDIKLYDESFLEFLPTELALITRLQLINFSSLDGIELLPNLISLEIESKAVSDLSLYIPLNESTFINHINDFTPIEKLHNLEKLTIINDNYIKKLDLTNLSKLRHLVITNNPNLGELIGLEDLKRLKVVAEYGNSILNEIDIKKYMINTRNTIFNVMDLCRYPHIVKSMKESHNLTLQLRLQINNLMFAEKTAIYNSFVIEPKTAEKVYKECLSLLEAVNAKNDMEIIQEIYDTVVRINTFDYEGLEKRFERFKDANYNYKEVPFELQKDFILLHSSYSAAVLHKSNCEGYVNLMRFLLSMKNIKSTNTYCSIKGKEPISGFVNHSILKININGKNYYFDPSLELVGAHDWFLKTYEEICQTHNLGIIEQFEYEKEYKNNEGYINKTF